MFSDRFKIGFFASRVLLENCCKVKWICFFVFGWMLVLFFVLNLSWFFSGTVGVTTSAVFDYVCNHSNGMNSDVLQKCIIRVFRRTAAQVFST